MRMKVFLFSLVLALIASVAPAQITLDGDVTEPEWGSPAATDNTTGTVTSDPVNLATLWVYVDDSGSSPGLYIGTENTGPAADDANNWGKWGVYVDSPSVPGAGGSFADTWGRNVGIGGTFDPGIQYHGWVDNGNGGQLDVWDGGSWVATGGSAIGDSFSNGNSVVGVEIYIPMSALGTPQPSSVDISVWTTGGNGGDPAVDALPSRTDEDWGGFSTIDETQTLNVVIPANVSDWNNF